jgi:hypothetical protein
LYSAGNCNDIFDIFLSTSNLTGNCGCQEFLSNEDTVNVFASTKVKFDSLLLPCFAQL